MGVIEDFRNALVDTDRRVSVATQERPALHIPAKKPAAKSSAKQGLDVNTVTRAASNVANAVSNPFGAVLKFLTSGTDERVAEWKTFYGATSAWLDSANTSSPSFYADIAEKLAEFHRLRGILAPLIKGGLPPVKIVLPPPPAGSTGYPWYVMALLATVALAGIIAAVKFSTGASEHATTH